LKEQFEDTNQSKLNLIQQIKECQTKLTRALQLT